MNDGMNAYMVECLNEWTNEWMQDEQVNREAVLLKINEMLFDIFWTWTAEVVNKWIEDWISKVLYAQEVVTRP